MREKERGRDRKGITCWKKARGSGSPRRCACMCVCEVAGGWGRSTVARNPRRRD